MRYAGRYRSVFWPAVLILIGVLALLVNSGWISADRIYLLLNLWPLILIVIGLELIVRRSMLGTARDVASVLIVLLAVVGAAVYMVAGPNPSSTQTLDTHSSASGIEQAELEIDVGSANFTVTSSNALEGDLYRAHIDYAGTKPSVAFDQSTGLVRISQSGGNFGFLQSRRFVMDVKVNQNVAWSITENSGATTSKLNLTGAQVGTININTGASRSDIYLGDPSGIVPVTINGGSLNVHIHRPRGSAASISVAGGAVNLNADGKQMHAIGNVSFQSPGFSAEGDAYRFEINGGACNVTLDTASAA
jgi:uncharacterized protein GlcG (DUF336 family)